MPEYENNALIRSIEDEGLRDRVLKSINAILARRQAMWGCVRYPAMVDHGETHTKNVFSLLTELLVNSQKHHLRRREIKLKDAELFCLIIATWLHDIGGKGGSISDKEFCLPLEARKKHPFAGGKIILEGGVSFLNLKPDEESAIADLVTAHSKRVAIEELPETKMLPSYGYEIKLPLLAILLSLSDGCDVQQQRVGPSDVVQSILNEIEKYKRHLEEQKERMADEKSREELEGEIEYLSTQPAHYRKHSSVRNIFFTRDEIILEPESSVVPEYKEGFESALRDVREELDRVRKFFAKYDITLKEVRALKDTDDMKGLYNQKEAVMKGVEREVIIINFAEPLRESKEELEEILDCRIREDIIDLQAKFDLKKDLESQVEELINKARLTPKEWQNEPIIVNVPHYHFATAIFIANLHGRMGHFPSILYNPPDRKAGATTYPVKGATDLQAVRDKARGGR